MVAAKVIKARAAKPCMHTVLRRAAINLYVSILTFGILFSDRNRCLLPVLLGVVI